MKILLVNNDGAGFADYVEIDEGTTVTQLFSDRLPHGRAQDYLIRVNRQPVPADQVLLEGDRVSLTPTKIEGASAFCVLDGQGTFPGTPTSAVV